LTYSSTAFFFDASMTMPDTSPEAGRDRSA
jgi:hypothetical protein